jgi:hypothetical protein
MEIRTGLRSKPNFHARMYHFSIPGYKKAFRNISFTGNFTNGKNRNLQSSRMEIRDFRGDIDGHKIQGNLVIHDLVNLNSRLDLAGKIELNSF